MLTLLRRIPHLFGKVMVAGCVTCGTVCCAWAFRILSRTGHDPSPLLGVTLAFFGGELAIMFAKTALSGRKPPKKEELYDRFDPAD